MRQYQRPPFNPTRLTGTPGEARFITELVQRQEAEGMTDQEFIGKNLHGVSLALWRKTRAGQLAVGMRLFMAGAAIVSCQVLAAAQPSVLERASKRGAGRRPKQARIAA